MTMPGYLYLSQSRDFDMRLKNGLSHRLLVSNYRISLASVTNAPGLLFVCFVSVSLIVFQCGIL